MKNRLRDSSAESTVAGSGFGSGLLLQPLLHVVRPRRVDGKEGRIQSTVAALEKHFGGEPRMRIALETGTRSPWVSRLLKSYGHEVIVANPRKITTKTGSESKNDRNDAEQLARMAAFDPKLLHPIEHRSLERQQDLNLIHTRSVLVLGSDHAGQFGTRAGQERRRTTAQLQFRGVPGEGVGGRAARTEGGLRTST